MGVRLRCANANELRQFECELATVSVIVSYSCENCPVSA